MTTSVSDIAKLPSKPTKAAGGVTKVTTVNKVTSVTKVTRTTKVISTIKVANDGAAERKRRLVSR